MKKFLKSIALASLAFVAVLLALPTQAQTTGFNKNDYGPYDYNASSNWVGGTVNGTWNSDLTLTTNQIVTFGADTTLTTPLTFDYAGNFPLALQAAAPGTVNLTLGGDIGLNTSAGTGANVTLGTGTSHLNVNLGGMTRTMTVAASRSLTLLDAVSNGDITKGGAGTLSLSGTNTYDGVTTINAGTVILRNNNSLGSAIGNTTLAAAGNTTAGGQLVVQNNITSPENITITGTTEAPQYLPAIFSSADSNTLSGNITLSGASGMRLGAASGASLTFNGPIARDGSGGPLILVAQGTNSTVVVNKRISLNGGKLSILGTSGTGTGIVQLNAPNDLGMTQVRDTVTLKLGTNDVLATNQSLTLGASGGMPGNDIGSLDLAGFNQTVNGLDAYSSGNPDDRRLVTNSAASGTSTLTVGSASGYGTFHGMIADGANAKVALTKIGLVALSLYGPNTYSGPTSIKAGQLIMKGGSSLSSNTSLSIEAGGTFDVRELTDGTTYTANFTRLSASGNGMQAGVNAANLNGSAAGEGGLIDMGTTPITLTWSGPSSGLNTNNQCLRTTSVALNLNNNQITVVVPGPALTAGTNVLIQSNPGISGSVNPTPLYTGGNGVASGYTGVLSIAENYAGSGSNVVQLIVTASPQPSPTNITYSVSGDQMVLYWPAGQGWTLQSQTNNLNVGLSTNWFTVSGATPPYTNTFNSRTVFYRLKY